MGSRYLTWNFIFRLVTVFIGVLELVMLPLFMCPAVSERPLLAVTVCFFIVSVLFLAADICKALPTTAAFRRIDATFHFVGFMFLLMGASAFLLSVMEKEQAGDAKNKDYRYTAAVFALGNAGAYLFVMLTLIKVNIVTENSV